MATNLDKFLQEKKSEEFEVNGKIFKANNTALNMLKVAALIKSGDATEDKLLTELFTIVFGKEAATEVFDLLNIQGIEAIAQSILEALGLSVKEK